MISIKEISLQKNSTNDEILAYLQEYGVLIVENFINYKQTSQLLKDFENIYNSGEKWAENTDYSSGRCCRVNRSLINSQRFTNTTEVFGSDWMKNICNLYLGEKSLLNHEIFLVHDVPNSVHVAQDLHHDKIPTLKFFIYLTDTTTENGSFYCVPGSHQITSEKEKKNRRNFITPDIAKTREIPDEYISQQIPIEGTAGTLIIFDTDVFHRAGKVSKGERFVMRGHSRKLEFLFNNNSKLTFTCRIINFLRRINLFRQV